MLIIVFFFSSRRRHTRLVSDWSSDVCSSDLAGTALAFASIVTYTRAKAEALGLHGEVGYAPRPERLVILSAGLILAFVAGGIAAETTVTSAESAWAGGRILLAIALGL